MHPKILGCSCARTLCPAAEVRISAYRQKKHAVILVEAPGAKLAPAVLNETCRDLAARDTVVLLLAGDSAENRRCRMCPLPRRRRRLAHPIPDPRPVLHQAGGRRSDCLCCRLVNRFHTPLAIFERPMQASTWFPPAAAFVISFFTSMAGISGAFLLLPLQMSVLGFTSPAVSATNLVFNLVATPAGVYRYGREKRVIWPLALLA